MGDDSCSHTIEVQADLTRQAYEAQPEPFSHEMRDRLVERGLQVGVGGLSRFFERHGIARREPPATPPIKGGKA